MMISPQKHDYISFTRRVVPAVKQKSRGVYGANHDYVLEEEDYADCCGQGYVISVTKHPKVIRGLTCRTVRVDAGSLLGVISVILDDTCKIIGEQGGLFARESEAGQSMYDVRGVGA